MLSIEGYEDLTEIGRGGFGVVYRARDTAFSREVAIKVLFGALRSEQARSRFERECRAAGSLSAHPHIVTVHGAGETDDGRPYLVMEYLSAGSLADRIALAGPVAARDVIRLGLGIAGALASAHAAGIIHRDVKPENVLYTAYGEPCLGDFGVARIAGATETRSGVITASLQHAAPEILGGTRPTEAADVYSLASTLVTAALGRPPFEGTDDEPLAALIARIATQPPPDLVAAGVPAPLARALTAGLAKDPADRTSTAEAFATELREAQSELGYGATPAVVLDDTKVASTTAVPPVDGATRRREPEPAPIEPTASKRSRRPRVLLGAGAGVLLLALAVPGFAMLRDATPSPDATTSDGGVSDGQATDGDTADGETTDGDAATDGEATDADATDGQTTDGEIADGQATEGETSDGRTEGETSDRQTDDGGATDGPVVANRSPQAVFTASRTSGKAPLEVVFDASSSSDPDGSIRAYRWEFGDGTTGSGRSVTHTFGSAGRYTVRLTVVDDDDADNQQASTIDVVANQAPVARFLPSTTSGKAPLPVTFDGSTSSDPDGTIGSYTWDLGDGSSATGRTTAHTYQSAGTYTVTLKVTDDDGQTAVTTNKITVTPANEPPVLPAKSFTFHVPVGQATVLVSDDRLTSGWSDPDGTADWLCVQWLPRTKDFWLDKADCDGSKLEFTAEKVGTYIIDYRIGESVSGGQDPGPPWSVQVNTITVIVE